MESRIEKLEKRIKRLELEIRELNQPEFDPEKLWNLYNFSPENKKTS